jgi:hypothetical protein
VRLKGNLLVAFSFRAKAGKEREFEELLNKPESGRMFAQLAGATRNILFLKYGRMIRVMEFAEGANPVPMSQLAEQDANVRAFLQKIGPLIEDGFDVQQPGSLEAFNQRVTFPVAYDVRP